MSEDYDYNLSSNIFMTELMKLANSIIWKNPTKAMEEEPEGIYINVDTYKAAYEGILTFESVYQFSYEALLRAGIPPAQAEKCCDNKYDIPVSKRDICVSLQREAVIRDYVEENNYYRMLFGLPDMADTDFIYAPEEANMDMTTPVHLLSIQDRYRLEEEGYLDKLREKYPDKLYLKYIGKKKIEPYTARVAPRFAILYIESSSYSNLTADFKDTYYQCRDYVDRVFYDKSFKRDNEYYDEFIALSILFMTLQLMLYKYLDADITRDFYDVESIRLLYESYGVPYYKEIPLEYHIKIVKNINRLLANKGNTLVFFDIFDVFNYANMDLYQYYLLKRRRFDDSGNPVFVYKEDGSLDEEACFEIAFVKVLVDGDIDLEVTDPKNKVVYEALTSDDPYWIDDLELITDLYNEQYNYIETKYMGINLTFDLYKILFESCYFLRMIQDKKFSTHKIPYFYQNTQRNVSLFSIVIFCCALICKRAGYEGNIPSNPAAIARVLGFNFKDDLNKIVEHAKSNKYLKDDDILTNIIADMNINSLADVDKVFHNIKELHDYINDKLYSVHDKDIFQAYYEFKKLTLTTEHINEIYQKSNGQMAESFEDLLLDSDPFLYQRLNDLEDPNDISNEISYVLVVLSNLASDIHQLEFLDAISRDTVIRYLLRMIDFFKSAKVDLKDFSIVYTINSPTFNLLKFIGDIHRIYEEWRRDDTIPLEDYIHIYETNYPWDMFLFLCKMWIIYEDWGCRDKFHFLVDELRTVINDHFTDRFHLPDFVISQAENTYITDRFEGDLQDVLFKVYDRFWYPLEEHEVKDIIDRLTDRVLAMYQILVPEKLEDLVDILFWSDVKKYIKDGFSMNDLLLKMGESLYIEKTERFTKDKFDEFKDEIIKRCITYAKDRVEVRDAIVGSYLDLTRSDKMTLSDKLIRLDD